MNATVPKASETASIKKYEFLADLYQRILFSGFNAFPEYMNLKGDTNYVLISNDKDLSERSTFISLDNLKTVKVIIEYHSYDYSTSLEDRRNAIKTAKDIFDFITDLKIGNYDKISKVIRNEKVPNVSLYYSNNSKNNRVVVTSTRRYDYTDFIINHSKILLEHTKDLDQLTKLIALDNEAEGGDLRWNLAVPVDKHWWRH